MITMQVSNYGERYLELNSQNIVLLSSIFNVYGDAVLNNRQIFFLIDCGIALKEVPLTPGSEA